MSADSDPELTARSARSATVITRSRHSPVCAVCGVALAITAPAPGSSSAPSSAARARMSPRSVTLREVTARTNSPAASSDAQSGARERSSSSATSVMTIRSSIGSGVSLARPVAQLAHDRIGHTQVGRLHIPEPASSLLSSAADVAATARTALERSISATEEPSALPAARHTAGSPAPDSIASDSCSSRLPSAFFAGLLAL